MSDLTPERMAELRALADAATEGPWKCWNGFPLADAVGQKYGMHGINRIGPEGDGGLLGGWTEDSDLYATKADAEFAATARTAVPELLDEIEQLRESERAFSEALGYGDGKTEPAATLAELIDPLTDALHAAREHDECPIYCALCGERLAATTCTRCHGSGCLPNAELAYLECDECAGAGKVHEGCVEQTYAQLAAKVAQVEALPVGPPSGGYYMVSMREVRDALAGGEQ